jgi:hypothetical protein
MLINEEVLTCAQTIFGSVDACLRQLKNAPPLLLMEHTSSIAVIGSNLALHLVQHYLPNLLQMHMFKIRLVITSIKKLTIHSTWQKSCDKKIIQILQHPFRGFALEFLIAVMFVVTLTLGSRPRQGFAKVWAKRKAQESHFTLLGVQETMREQTLTLPSELSFWELESQWTPEFLEKNFRGQNPLD